MPITTQHPAGGEQGKHFLHDGRFMQGKIDHLMVF